MFVTMLHPQLQRGICRIQVTDTITILMNYNNACTRQINADMEALDQIDTVYRMQLFMVALCNRADHHIFCPVVSIFFFFLLFPFFPRLISAVVDWMSTILWHMVWP